MPGFKPAFCPYSATGYWSRWDSAQSCEFCLCRTLNITDKTNKKRIHIVEVLFLFLSVRKTIFILYNACCSTRPLICFHPMASYMTQMLLKCVHLKEFIVLFQTGHQPSENGLKGDVRHSRIRRQSRRKASLALRHIEGVFSSPND